MGKTYEGAIRVVTKEKHPHGRGEDSGDPLATPNKTETPPRAWGRHRESVSKLKKARNTPTGVGKTHQV
ncbi:hypothetical protein BMETH_748_2 [methanotrophic bacterial endosymbiont of Bathymodiolus sp.]|nr:hypothetical protein BMETH_748_2 [methanotrophic bacterial endosymbiont of Bathymodiolus sp.]